MSTAENNLAHLLIEHAIEQAHSAYPNSKIYWASIEPHFS